MLLLILTIIALWSLHLNAKSAAEEEEREFTS